MNDPIGVITSISSPAPTAVLSQVDIRPPSTTADATRSEPGRPERGWQIEYDWRTSSPSMVARKRQVLPGQEGVLVTQLGRYLERHRHRLVGEPLDRADPQRVEPRPPAQARRE